MRKLRYFIAYPIQENIDHVTVLFVFVKKAGILFIKFINLYNIFKFS